MVRAVRARGWLFTINNYNDDDVFRCCNVLPDIVQYIIVGKEVGDEQQTPHLQGYLYNTNAISFNTVKDWLPRAHIEAAKGSAEDNRVYCSKQGNVLIEHGVKPVQGNRTDLGNMIEACKKQASTVELIEEHTNTYAKYPKFVELCKKTFAKKRDPHDEFCFKCYWGPARAGKTRRAYDEFKGQCHMQTPCLGEWWDGYDNHQNVVIDEADKHYLKLSEFLSILDRYPTKVRIKGGFVEFNARNIVCTANKHPEDWYPNCSEQERVGLVARFHVIEHIGPFKEPDLEIDFLELKSNSIL